MNPEQIFWLAHENLPRQAPGSAETVRLLLRLAGRLPERPRIVDIGCGTGPASLLLARETGGLVVAVDTHRPFLARLSVAAADAGFADRIWPVVGSMHDLPLPDGSVDLIWSEGSAYVMGFDEALAGWHRLLTPSGVLVVTEAEWSTSTPAAGARAFWDAGYPAMRTVDGNIRAAIAAGWTVLASYRLPDSDWSEYYDALGARIEQLRARGIDPAVLDEVGAEIDIRRRYGDDYGYTGYVLRRR